MQVTRQITNDITYVGVSDRRLSLFEIFSPYRAVFHTILTL